MITLIEVPREAGGAEERREVSPGGFTPCADPGGVDPVFWGIGAKPAHGGFAILELGWKSRIIAQSIADTGDDIAPLREFPHRARMFVAAFPSPPVDPQDCRQRTAVPIGQVKIQRLPWATACEIGNVVNGSHGLEKKPTPARGEGRSANLTCRHSSLRWKLQTAWAEVDEMTGLLWPGV